MSHNEVTNRAIPFVTRIGSLLPMLLVSATTGCVVLKKRNYRLVENEVFFW